MILLLPPSERKAPAPPRRAPVDLAALRHPALTGHRLRVLDALAAASASPGAAGLLGAGPGAAEDVARNARWRTEPAHPAARLFTGVLFEALGLHDLDAAARRRAAASVRVVSAAYGLLHLRDAVPAHRLSMGTDLPGVGPLATSWQPHLAAELDPLLTAGGAAAEVVVDCRSAAYAAAWRPPRALAHRVVGVRVVTERDGARIVVSHAAKHAHGLLARHLVTRPGRAPRDVEAVAAAASERFAVELTPARPGRPRQLDVVLRG